MSHLTTHKHRESSYLRAYKALYICRESSTNQPFLCKTNPILSAVGGFQMNLSIYLQTAYENKRKWTLGENKPKQSQFYLPQESLPCLPSVLSAVASAKAGAQLVLSIVEGPKGNSQLHCLELPCKEYLPGLEKRWHYELIGDKIV